jgi:hypothetical protein
MWLVACNPGDAAAVWAARLLRERGLEPLELVSAEALAYSLRLEHRLGADGASVRIELADGRRVAGEETAGVLNRLTHVPTEHLGVASEGERSYAVQEISALFLSWLNAMPCPVLNRPTPLGLGGPHFEPLQWFAMAARAGLPTPRIRISSRPREAEADDLPAATELRGAIVAGGSQYGEPLPRATAAACVRLAELSGAAILGVALRRDAGGDWEFAGASSLPDLRLGGERLADGLAAELLDGRSR